MNKAISKIRVAAILLAILGTAGCAGVGQRLDPPRVSLANIKVLEVTGLETAFEIQLRVINANAVDLNVKGINAELDINGQSFATGVSNTPVDIPSYGTELVTVTVYSSVIKMFRSAYGLKDSEELKYRLTGKVRVSGTNMLPTTLPFEAEGQVTLNPSKDQP